MNGLFAEHAIVASAKLWRGADRKFVMGLARRAANDPVPVIGDEVDLNL